MESAMEELRIVWDQLLQPAVLLGLVGWLIRSLFNKYIEKDLSRFKDGLARESKERETKFAILQTRRAEVVETLYHNLINYLASVEKLLNPMGYEGDPDKKVQLDNVGKAQADFGQFYLQNKIFFSHNVCEGIDSLFHTLRPSVSKFGLALAMSEKHPELHHDKFKAWDEGWAHMQEIVPPILGAIELDFRELLGVTMEDAKP
jgi:hypothetical protein